MKKTAIITILISLVIGVVGFVSGMQFQKMQRGTSFGSQNQTTQGRGFLQQRAGGNNTFSAGNRPVTGEIINMDNSSLTIKMTDGSSKIVLISDKTIVSETTNASKSALTTGQKVLIIGTNNSDGSVTAQNVQLNPQFMGAGRTPGTN